MVWGEQERGAWRHGCDAEADSKKEIYEPGFIGRVLSFIDVAEVYMKSFGDSSPLL
jgi:hypothetical protein